MYAWPVSEVPSLPGRGRDLRIHSTATGGRITLDPGPVARIYVCGITPYDATHMGHAATYNAFDLVQRVWLDTKRQVHYVQNVTDVDDWSGPCATGRTGPSSRSARPRSSGRT